MINDFSQQCSSLRLDETKMKAVLVIFGELLATVARSFSAMFVVVCVACFSQFFGSGAAGSRRRRRLVKKSMNFLGCHFFRELFFWFVCVQLRVRFPVIICCFSFVVFSPTNLFCFIFHRFHSFFFFCSEFLASFSCYTL